MMKSFAGQYLKVGFVNSEASKRLFVVIENFQRLALWPIARSRKWVVRHDEGSIRRLFIVAYRPLSFFPTNLPTPISMLVLFLS